MQRFTRAERLYHWVNAGAVFFQIGTGFFIWAHLDDWKVNGLKVIPNAHFWLGGGTLLLAGLAFLALRRARVESPRARFAPGQRFNLRAFQVLLSVMLATGLVGWFGRGLGLARSTVHSVMSVHAWCAYAVGALVIGHIAMVLAVPKNRGILAAMWRGTAAPEVLDRVAPQWVAAVRSGAQPARSGTPEPSSRI